MGSGLGVRANAAPKVVFDNVSIFYIVLTVVWTALIATGCAYLVAKRNHPILRLRGLLLSITAVLSLHLYWISCQIAYILGPLFPGDAEYWVMGTYLPLGIALFQASNSRFLHVAKMQKRFVEKGERKPRPQGNGLIARFRRMEYTAKVLTLVGIGMFFQIFVTILMYLISRKWHSSWGIPGTEVKGDTPHERMMNMGRGWEWWHTAFWQFFWAWVFAPYILWQARNIHDTQGWRTQTIACCVANLPATPMWLVSLYVPAMAPVNKYFVPPQWLCMSIMVVQVFTIFLPAYEVHRHQTLRQETLDSIAQWESKNSGTQKSTRKSIVTGSTAVDSVFSSGTGWKSTHSNESILTMGALEHVLERNPGPLLEFSALRDFSGENIAFLTSVADWKGTFPRTAANGEDIVREKFNRALRIYAEFISSRDAEFQVNLSSQILKELEAVFEKPARILFGDKQRMDPATPFALPDWPSPSKPSTDSDHGSEKTIIRDNVSEQQLVDRVQYWGEIPDGFHEKVFDNAESSVKYSVLTNTWPKFVKERRVSMDSAEA